jgi:hypothetical protein
VNVLVLGMHRSGTSAVASALRAAGLFGWDAGEENPTQPDNPNGYAERIDVVGLDNRMLAALDWTWDSPPATPPPDMPGLGDLVAEGRELVARQLEPHGEWLIKDPRVSLVLPYWRQILLDRFVPVVMVRKPVEVAWSLAVRDKLPVPLGLALWNAYSRHLAVGLAGLPAIIVDYAALVDDAPAVSSALIDALTRLGVRAPLDRVAAAAAIEPELRRATHPAEHERPEAPEWRAGDEWPNWVFEPVHVTDRFDITPSVPQPSEVALLELQRHVRSLEVALKGISTVGIGSSPASSAVDSSRESGGTGSPSDLGAVRHQGVDPVVRPGAAAPALAAEQSAVALELRMRAVESQLGPGRSRRRSPFRAVTALLRRLTRPDNPLFDPVWYRATYPDVKASDAYGHYLIHGVAEGRDPNPLFDTSWYVERNPDIASKRLTPLDHFLLHGALEGRDPGPDFDSAWYLTENPDVAAAGMNPLLHYFRTGAREGRAPRAGYSGEPVTSPGIASAASEPPRRGLIARSIRIAQQSTKQSLRLIRIAAKG